ncbi:MAG: hypothetical protein HY973_04465 [Candidatus Kerfeldbacteria bacterium]|nr:hypothetical protein [Candidatus Kerfeldbacteria bacterium]
MTITIMNNSTALSLAEIKDFLKSAESFQFKSVSKQERNEWIPAVIRQHNYCKRKRTEKGLLRRYLMKMTGLSRPQIGRLIKEYKKPANIG